MQPFQTLTSLAAPLDAVNVDTDQIIPKQFLKRIERTGYGDFLFFDWRKNADGTPNPDFALNKPQYQGAEILIAGRNFGCGSSREHAAWALTDFGFRCVISSSFADIFFSNAAKNGMLLVVLPDDKVSLLLQRARQPGYKLTVSLETQTVQDDQGFHESFSIDPFRRSCLLQGLDDIGLTLRHSAALENFEKQHDAAFWSAPRSNAAQAGANA